MLNLKVRFRNPVFITQLILSILTPVLTYAGLTMQDMTSWPALGKLMLDALLNPYVMALVAISVWNALNDPTTKGIGDSSEVLGYTEPKTHKGEKQNDGN